METALVRWLKACVLFLAVAGGLSLPLVDILTYPTRLSVLPSLQVDAATYDAIGHSLAATGHVSEIPARQPPGFVVLLALAYSAFGYSWVTAKIVLWCALVASTGLAGWLGRRVWGSGAGLVAALLTATSPALRHYVGTIQYEVVTAAWVLVLLTLATRAVDAGSRANVVVWTVSAGIAGGLLALTREVFVGVLPIVAAWLATRLGFRFGRRLAVASAAVFLLIAAAPVALWSVSQSRTHGQLVVITDKGTATFALGNNAAASGTYNIDHVVEPSGLAFISEMPYAAARLAVRKLLYFWGVLRDGWNVPRPTALWAYRACGGIIPLEVWLPFARGGWLLVAFVIALSTMTQRRLFASWWILPAVVIAVMLAHVATLSSHRFAVPILPLVFVMIGGPVSSAVAIALHWITSKRWRIALAFLTIAVAVGLQRQSPSLNVRYVAADLDTMNEVNEVDPVLGRSVRVTPAAGGRRTAMILSDEYLPAGDVRLRIRARRGHSTAGVDTPVARVTFISSDGAPGCAEDIPLGSLVTDQFADIWVFCSLPSEGPATLIVDVLGVVDLAFDDIRMTWLPVRSRDRVGSHGKILN